MEDPQLIYLEPAPISDPAEGRMWCQDDVWPVDVSDEREGGVAYVRSDLVLAALAADACEPGEWSPEMVELWELVRGGGT